MLAGKKTKVGIAVPQMFPYGPVDMGFVEEHLRLVESLGYDSVWTQDSVLGTMDTLDPFTCWPTLLQSLRGLASVFRCWCCHSRIPSTWPKYRPALTSCQADVLCWELE